MLRRVIAITTVVSALLLGVIFFATTPSSAGPLGILSLLVFMYLTVLGVLTFLFYGISLLIVKTPLGRLRPFRFKKVSFRASYYRASVVALAPVMLIALQSVSQVGIYQILLILFFLITAWVYITNRIA